MPRPPAAVLAGGFTWNRAVPTPAACPEQSPSGMASQAQVPPAQSSVAPAPGAAATPAVQTPNTAPSTQASLSDGRQLRGLSDGSQLTGGAAQQPAAPVAVAAPLAGTQACALGDGRVLRGGQRQREGQDVATTAAPARPPGRWLGGVAETTQPAAPKSSQPVEPDRATASSQPVAAASKRVSFAQPLVAEPLPGQARQATVVESSGGAPALNAGGVLPASASSVQADSKWKPFEASDPPWARQSRPKLPPDMAHQPANRAKAAQVRQEAARSHVQTCDDAVAIESADVVEIDLPTFPPCDLVGGSPPLDEIRAELKQQIAGRRPEFWRVAGKDGFFLKKPGTEDQNSIKVVRISDLQETLVQVASLVKAS